MCKNTFILLAFILISFYSCKQVEINEKNLSGEWIISKAAFKNTDIIMASKTPGLALLPVGYENKSTLKFNIEDSTVNFPGINTKDVPCKWMVKDKKLIISFDTLRFENYALLSIDSLKIGSILKKDTALKKIYNFKRDSILKATIIDINDFKFPLSIYAGTYTIAKTKEVLILASPTTRFELLNFDYILNKNLDEMFKGK